MHSNGLYEVISDNSEGVSDSYTGIIYATLKPYLPNTEVVSEDIIRDYPSEPLVERSPSEIEKLYACPFFSL